MSDTRGNRSRNAGPGFVGFRSWIVKAWRWLYQTPDTLSSIVQRQARLVAGVSLALLLLLLSITVLLLVSRQSIPGPTQSEAYLFLASAPLLLMALAVNRQGRVSAAAGLVVLVAFIDTWGVVLVNRGTNSAGIDLLFYPLLSIILAGLLLPAWATAVITAGNLLALVLVSTLTTPAQAGLALGPALFYVVMSALSGLASNLRQRDLSRLDAREHALADSENKYRRIVDLAQEGIWIVNANQHTTFVNRSMAVMLDYTEQELLDGDPMAFVDEASRPTARAVLAARRQGQTGKFDIMLRRRDGSPLWVIPTGTPLTDDAGQNAGMLSLMTDITQRKQAETALSESQERFASAFQYAPVGMALVGLDGRWLQVNPTMCDMLGYSEAELLATNYQQVTHPDDLASNLTSQSEVIAGRQPASHIEKRYVHKLGYVIWAWVSGALVRDAQGGPLYFVAQIQDITDRKQALESLHQSSERYRQKLEETERLREFSASIIRNMAEGLVVADEHGTITLVNAALAALLGYTEQEMIGQDQWILIAPSAVEAARQIVTGRPQGLTTVYESVMITKAGVEVAVLIAATSIVKDGNFSGTLGTITDLTGRKRGEAELQRVNAKLTNWLAEAEQRTHDISLLNELGELLQTSQSVDEAYALVPTIMPALFPRSAGRLYVIKESRNLLDAVGQWGPVAGGPVPFEPSECWALRRGHSHVVQSLYPDLEAGQAPAVICSHVREPRPAAYLCVPMMAQNESLGVLHLQRPATVISGEVPLAWSEGQMRLARTVADTVAMALASLRLRETLRHQSIRDPLTGLFNRRYLEETLDRELYRVRREQRPLGVMMLDIDHFKRFNDALGHAAGDQILCAVSRVLRSVARAEDIVCRYGGEEFIVILPEASLAITLGRAEGICRAVRTMASDLQRGAPGSLTVSIGVAGFPEHGDNGPDIIRMADATLYQAKRAGRDQVLAAVSAA